MSKTKGGATRSDALVLFGVTGDLAHKMIFPALYAMAKRGALKVPVIGVASPKWSLAQLRKRVKDSIQRSGGIDNQQRPSPAAVLAQICERRLSTTRARSRRSRRRWALLGARRTTSRSRPRSLRR